MLKYSKSRILLLICIVLVLWSVSSIKSCSAKSRAAKAVERAYTKSTEQITKAANKFATSFCEVKLSYIGNDLTISGAFTSLTFVPSTTVTLESKNNSLTLEQGEEKELKLEAGEELIIGLPEHLALKVKLQTGDIAFEYFNGNSLTLETGAGDIRLSNLTCSDKLEIISNTGDIDIEYLKAESLTIQSTTGDLDICSAEIEKELVIDMATGVITAEELQSGRVKVDLSLGDVELGLKPLEEYSFKLTPKAGEWHLADSKGSGTLTQGQGTRPVEVTTSLGDIRIK